MADKEADARQRGARQRIDTLLVARGLVESRELGRRLILAGEVTVDDRPVNKPGTVVAADADIRVKARPRFVSRGGDKLDAALEAFAISGVGRVCADVGASTGGFTDCLLQRGACKVYAIDVGYGQLAHALRTDPRVIVMERTNARYLECLPEPVSLVTADASFISLRLLLPVIWGWLEAKADVVPLVKPQFEAGRRDVGKGGVVRDPDVHRRVLDDVLRAAQGLGFAVRGLVQSPLKGPEGNVEFLAWLNRGETGPAPDVASLIEHVTSS